MTILSVNINKFALIRNARGINQPDLIDMCERCIEYGAQGITVHPIKLNLTLKDSLQKNFATP